MNRLVKNIAKSLLAFTLIFGSVVTDSLPIYAAETVLAKKDYDEFASEIINNTTSWKATALVKSTNSSSLDSTGATKIIKGPDDYFFLIFDSDAGIDEKMNSISGSPGVKYATKNYNFINKVSAKSGNDLKKDLKKYIDNIISAEEEAEEDVDEAQVEKWEESDGPKVKFKPFSQFYKEYNGTAHDIDGAYGAQCVDGASFYLRWLGYSVGVLGNAVDYWTARKSNGLLEYCIEIPKGEELQNGDIIIYSGPSSCGHIGIYYDGKCFGQNQCTDGSGGPFNCVSFSCTPGYLGALRPKIYKNGSESSDAKSYLEKE